MSCHQNFGSIFAFIRLPHLEQAAATMGMCASPQGPSMAQRGAMLPPTIKQEATAHLAAMMTNYPPAPAEKDSGPLKRIRIASVQGQPPTAADEARAPERGSVTRAVKFTSLTVCTPLPSTIVPRIRCCGFVTPSQSASSPSSTH